MNEKPLALTLIIIFGLAGIFLIVAAWTMPSLQSDKITACIAGVIGIGFSVIRGLMLRHESDGHHEEEVSSKVLTGETNRGV